jgi:hypothetical protein
MRQLTSAYASIRQRLYEVSFADLLDSDQVYAAFSF